MANEIARRFRKTMTPQEVKLLVHLRGWRNRGFHFWLIVEVDGGQHGRDAQLESDQMRDRTF
jgi:very-short-patch-repair endonuclease